MQNNLDRDLIFPKMFIENGSQIYMLNTNYKTPRRQHNRKT